MHVFFIWKSIIVLDVKCYAADSKYNMCLILGIFNFLKETAGDGGDHHGGDVGNATNGIILFWEFLYALGITYYYSTRI
jgi:hypothetical protein